MARSRRTVLLWRRTYLLIGGGIVFITTVGALAQDARALCSQGKRLKEAGKLEEAAAAYREAARVDPTLAEAHWGLGWVYIQLGLRSQAATEFVAVLDLTRDTALKQECQRTLERMGIKPPSPPLPSEEALSTVAGITPASKKPTILSLTLAQELLARGERFAALQVLQELVAEDVERTEAERLLAEIKRGRRDIRVRAVADAVFRSQPEWERRLRDRFEAAAGHLARQVPIDLTLVAVEPWEPQETMGKGLEIIEKLRASVPLEGADVVLAFMAQRREAPSGEARVEIRNYTLGLAPCFTGYALVTEVIASQGEREWRVPEEQLRENLLHELGHLLGAVHVSGHSVMRATPEGPVCYDFDPLNAEVIQACRWVDFKRHFASLSVEELERLVELYDKLAAGPATDDGVHFYRAVALTFLDRYEEALREYERVLSTSWEDAYTHFNKAELHERVGDIVRARAHWKVAASLGGPEEIAQRARAALARTALDDR